MQVITSVKKMQEFVQGLKTKNKTIGFVPTMGALHEGHMSLVKQSKKENDYTIVSIFVNPIQFGKNEDLSKYPRPKKNDLLICQKYGVDVIFYPSANEMYPRDFFTYIEVNKLQDTLCGISRPGHFKGVVTVVAKLFNICLPNRAYFGQKDAQQVLIIKKMVDDLNFFIQVRVMPIIREKDGLAMSSRNIYLNDEERKQALVLYKSLNVAKDLIKTGNLESKYILAQMKKIINSASLSTIDYVNIVDGDTLKNLHKVKVNTLIAVAVKIGKTRLIDNIIIKKL